MTSLFLRLLLCQVLTTLNNEQQETVKIVSLGFYSAASVVIVLRGQQCVIDHECKKAAPHPAGQVSKLPIPPSVFALTDTGRSCFRVSEWKEQGNLKWTEREGNL